MTTLAIVEPTTLVGIELREALGRRPELWSDLRLLSHRQEDVGTLVDVRGSAAMVQRVQDNSLEGVDLAFFCHHMSTHGSMLDHLPAATTAVVLAADAPPELGEVALAGFNLDTVARRGSVLISPHPAAVLLAHLLDPLQLLDLKQGIATFLQPASMRDQAALDEVFEQTRAILNFSPQPTPAIFGRQLAFNLLPTPEPQDHVVRQLRAILGEGIDLSLQIVQAGIFHCYAVSLYCQFQEDPGAPAVSAALDESPVLELVDEPELLGPIDAPARDEILVGPIREDKAHPGGYWIWAVMDNLTRGSVLNALDIASALFG